MMLEHMNYIFLEHLFTRTLMGTPIYKNTYGECFCLSERIGLILFQKFYPPENLLMTEAATGGVL